jgi:hypothetical protein
MIDKLRAFLREARTKATTYVALAIAGVSQLAEHAEDLVNGWPGLKAFLPSSAVLDHISHWTLTALGLLVVYTRVRRLLGIPPTMPPPANEAIR